MQPVLDVWRFMSIMQVSYNFDNELKSSPYTVLCRWAIFFFSIMFGLSCFTIQHLKICLNFEVFHYLGCWNSAKLNIWSIISWLMATLAISLCKVTEWTWTHSSWRSYLFRRELRYIQALERDITWNTWNSLAFSPSQHFTSMDSVFYLWLFYLIYDCLHNLH